MTRFRIGNGVRWSVGTVGVTLVDACGEVHTLGYPEAAIFDLLSRRYSFAKVAALTAGIACLDRAGAEALVRSTLERWADCGILERSERG